MNDHNFKLPQWAGSLEEYIWAEIHRLTDLGSSLHMIAEIIGSRLPAEYQETHNLPPTNPPRRSP